MYRFFFFLQAEDGIRDLVRSRGLGDVYKRQVFAIPFCVQLNKGTKQFNLLQLSNKNAHPSTDGKLSLIHI